MSTVVVTLLFKLCLAADPTQGCQTERMLFEGSQFQCMMFGQQAIAQKLRGRPDLVMVGGYKCKAEPSGFPAHVG